jgi:hypothetical protein
VLGTVAKEVMFQEDVLQGVITVQINFIFILGNQAVREIGEKATENFFNRNPGFVIALVVLAAIVYLVIASANAGSGGSLGSGKVNDWLIGKGTEWLDAPKCSRCLSTRNLYKTNCCSSNICGSCMKNRVSQEGWLMFQSSFFTCPSCGRKSKI